MSVNLRQPGSFDEQGDNNTIYTNAKEILQDMTQAGSLASKGHESMLDGVEALRTAVSNVQPKSFNPIPEKWDVDEWRRQLFQSENLPNGFSG